MLIQIHQQEGKNHANTQMVIQGEAKSREDQIKLLDEAKRIKPLQEGMQWMICNEDSDYFWKTIYGNGITK